MTVKPGDRETNQFCGCVMEFTPENEWRTVERCITHCQHAWVCDKCPVGPFDDEAMRAVLAVSVAPQAPWPGHADLA